MTLHSEIEWIHVPVTPEFNAVPKTLFTQTEQWAEHFPDFYMSKYLITFDQYDHYCKQTGRPLPYDNGWGRGKRPVINVSWFDAMDFALFHDALLPHAYQFMYAAYGSEWEKNTKFYWGQGLSTKLACFESDRTVEVGSYKPNQLGFYDIHGNVCEWLINDSSSNKDNPNNIEDTHLGKPMDHYPFAPSQLSFKMFAKGSWATASKDFLFYLNNGGWGYSGFKPNVKMNTIGFRLVKFN